MHESQKTPDDWSGFSATTAAVTAMLDRLLHHGQQCGPKTWRTKSTLRKEATTPRSNPSLASPYGLL